MIADGIAYYKGEYQPFPWGSPFNPEPEKAPEKGNR